jgi:coproporphyrinogen III oxidase
VIEVIDKITAADVNKVEDVVKNWQENIISSLISIDSSTEFIVDNWQSKLGRGATKVVSSSNLFESAGVNFSCVSAKELPHAALPGRNGLAGKPYMALGVSTVIHPRNPYVPTSHANLRFFVVDPNGEEPLWWFGGGYDLTPYYGFNDDCVLWHQGAYDVCESYEKGFYKICKEQCDKYFYLPHRNEPRGIGGIFFDNLSYLGFDRTLDFITDVGSSYINSYSDIVRKRCSLTYGEKEKSFQEYRRGRYVEFNLLHDRGTKFGIDSGGRTESVLMSLPPVVRWNYNYTPKPNSREALLYRDFLVEKEWLDSKT